MDKKQLTFEDYLSLSRDNDTTKLSINKISQVLSINGFWGHSKLTRKGITDALNSVNLIPATRSTINLNNGPIRSRHMSTLSLHELKSDIEELGWQECPFGSIVTIDPATIGVKNRTVKKNKNKTVKKNTSAIKQVKLKSAESLVVDEIANRDDDELTSPMKKMNKTMRMPLNDADYSTNMISHVKKVNKKTRVSVGVLNDADQFSWTRSGCSNDFPYPRTYFKCKNWKQGCPARREVSPDPIDPSILIITYNGEHDHPIP